jgi:pyruvate dehydrogenase E2 component (dihydrolipoamide acetyltransferase)
MNAKERNVSAIDVKVPDIGDFKNVPVIEILVKVGDNINAEDALVTLESDKATMDVPSPTSGTVKEILIKVGDKVAEGTLILRLDHHDDGALSQPTSLIDQLEPPHEPSPATPAAAPAAAPAGSAGAAIDFSMVHASPGVRRVARELDVDLTKIKGSGEKGRITKEDVLGFLQGPATAAPAAAMPSGGAGIPEIPAQDFSKFGPIETKPLSRIKKLSGPYLHRAWLNIPHVTHNDDADITDIEAYRKELDTKAKDEGYRVTMLSFLLKASVNALKAHPEFNASLSPEKDTLIYKRYYHIGIAVDTPEGLVVPVIRDVDRKGIVELSREMASLSKKARDGKLSAADMSGASFTISSLGGIGGTAFTPIVNAPEVAILGVVRSKMAPVWDGKEFKPRLMLPLCVSYDHRVIDGALAARFTRTLAHVLEDVRRLVL